MCTNAINTNASDNNISDSGKKKTKLGYHRSSVACAYCRRRKIRCIPSAHGSPRCENCLKHGRECQYLPVDQQIVTKKPLKIDTKARRSHSMTSAVGLVLRPSLENLERFRNAAADQQVSCTVFVFTNANRYQSIRDCHSMARHSRLSTGAQSLIPGIRTTNRHLYKNPTSPR